MSDIYEKIYAQSLNEPDTFWAEAAEDVHWYKKWDTVLDDSREAFLPLVYRWHDQQLLQRPRSACGKWTR